MVRIIYEKLIISKNLHKDLKLGNTRRKSLDTVDICKFYHSELKRGKRSQNMPFKFFFILDLKVLKSLDFCQITLDKVFYKFLNLKNHRERACSTSRKSFAVHPENHQC